MTPLRDEFENDFSKQLRIVGFKFHYDSALWAARWAMEKCAELAIVHKLYDSPAEKITQGIRQMLKELS